MSEVNQPVSVTIEDTCFSTMFFYIEGHGVLNFFLDILCTTCIVDKFGLVYFCVYKFKLNMCLYFRYQLCELDCTNTIRTV